MIDSEKRQRVSKRGRRALILMAIAVTVVVPSSFAYLYPSLIAKSQPALPSSGPGPVTRAGDFVSYEFVTPFLGWALEAWSNRSPASGQFSVWRTVDGAKHWQTQLEGPISPTLAGPPSIQFFDKAHGFVAFGIELYRTVDGGLNWAGIALPDAQHAFITFADSQREWVAASIRDQRCRRQLAAAAQSASRIDQDGFPLAAGRMDVESWRRPESLVRFWRCGHLVADPRPARPTGPIPGTNRNSGQFASVAAVRSRGLRRLVRRRRQQRLPVAIP